ncbi:MAG: uracil-DNA glycosylase, partial [Proteobacteria bacterium]|nr:uracil-DNA glycosylase [Pseudomonadota bacterium]
MAVFPATPDPDCRRCPRLAALRDRLRAEHPGWHNGPVPSFGGLDASLLVVGLAPGREGANRTGRPFTGDGAGDVLYPALLRHGLATGTYRAAPGDGLDLVRCRISNAVRCLPPGNKPLAAEAAACRGFLVDELAAMDSLRVVLALGRIAHGAVVAA